MLMGNIKSAAGGQVEFSRIVFGAGSMGCLVDKDTSYQLMDRYFEAGGNAFDTGRVYMAWVPGCASQSEKTLGAWVRDRGIRDKVKICTKGGHPEWRNFYYSRIHPECIEYDILTSLAVLQMDYVDVYYLHRDDTNVPVSEIMDALDIHVKAGRCKALGASNWTFERIMAANEYAVKNGKTPFTVSSIQWTLAECWRRDLLDQTCLCMEPKEYKQYLANGFPVISYTSQANGFFSKYIEGGEDALKNERIQIFLNDVNRDRAKKVDQLCKELGCSPAALSIAYITNNPLNGFAIIGTSSMKQLNDSLTASDLALTQEQLDWLTR